MNFLASLSTAVINAGSAALAGGNGVPGLPSYTLGDKVEAYQGKSIWTLYEGVKKVSCSAGCLLACTFADSLSPLLNQLRHLARTA